jgi:hypothetical protein
VPHPARRRAADKRRAGEAVISHLGRNLREGGARGAHKLEEEGTIVQGKVQGRYEVQPECDACGQGKKQETE